MRLVPRLSFAVASILFAACAARPEVAKPPLAATHAGAENVSAADAVVADGTAADDDDAAADEQNKDEPQALALEECQAAAELLDQGDTAGAVRRIDQCYSLMLSLADDGSEADEQARRDIRLLVAELVARVYRGDSPSSPTTMASWDLGLPMVDNEHVQREIKSFTTVERESLLAAYRRSGRYRQMIVEKLDAAGLPRQLAWLPLVESAFKVSALSRASALGLWQFISSTGLRYGLKRDAWVDERLDPEKSTDAAIAYLADLHRIFGDWPKALAAYNCGEGRIQRLQSRSKTEYFDFWDLYGQLPSETRRYFPRLLAVLHLLEDPARYGLELPEPDAPPVETERVRVERPVKLADLDKALGLQPGTIAALNPELRRGATPKHTYELEVPVAPAEQVVAAVATLAVYEPRDPVYVVHRVRSGETLSNIAERYRTSVGAIVRANRIRSVNRIRPGQRLRIPAKI